MKIYAVRDRLIHYFMTPFCGADDKQVLAGLANHINNPEGTYDAIKQAPHHFEIWKLGEVQENGLITSKIDFLADCSSLVRASVRSTTDAGTGADAPARGRRPQPPGGGRAGADTEHRPTENAAPATPGAAADPH